MPRAHEELIAVYLGEHYRGDDGEFFIGRGRRPADTYGMDIFGIKGYSDPGELLDGMEYVFVGNWDEPHPKFGLTFAAKSFVLRRPHSQEGVVRYLQEAPGIGPVTALLLWQKFGEQAIDILKDTPDVAAAALGGKLPSDKAESASERLREMAGLQHCMVDLIELLDRRGFPKNTPRECIRVWGADAPRLIRKNPYKLQRFRGIGFLGTDKMYLDLRLPPGRLLRQGSCAAYSIVSDTEGHTWMPREIAYYGVKERVGGCDVQPDRAIEFSLRSKQIAERVDSEGRHWLADIRRANAEERLAQYVARAVQEPSAWPSVDHPAFDPLSDHQREKLAIAMSGPIGILGGSPGTGKAQPLDAPVLTPNGWAKMGDIKPGQFVIGGDGKPVKVKAVFPQGEKQIYAVLFSDGSRVECCEDHLWLTTTHYERKLKSPGRVRSLKQIAKTINRSDGSPQHRIPMVAPVEFEQKPIRLDPYALGLLLGDGCFRGGTPTFCKPDDWVAVQLSSRLPQHCQLIPIEDDGRPGSYRITSNRHSPNPLVAELKALGLWGLYSQEKFVPDAYKYGSSETRLAVLNGLLDTDAHAGGHNVEYSTSSPRLAEDVQFLVESLGGRVTVSSRVPAYVHKGERRYGDLSYRILVGLPSSIQPFRTPIKASKYIPRSKYPPTRRIVAIEPVGIKHAQCISVDSQDGLYVTNNFVVTHNTFTAACIIRALCQLFGERHVAVVCPTGKAAVRCTEAMSAYGLPLQARTIHSFLGVVKAGDGGWEFEHKESNPFRQRFIVCDETSMVDCGLMASFLAARPAETSILFVGDVNQLPPVGAGAPLRDLIAVGLPYGELTEIRRNSGTIVRACSQIRQGMRFEVDDHLDPDDRDNPRNLGLIPANSEQAPEKLVQAVCQFRDSPTDIVDPATGERRRIDPIWDVQVIVAVNKKSLLARHALNKRLQCELNPNGRAVSGNPFRVGDKVIQLKNEWLNLLKPRDEFEKQAPVANGEFGRVLEVEEKRTVIEFLNPTRVVFIRHGKVEADKPEGDDKEGDGETSTGGSTGNLDLGYAVTAHKMQGSECPVVVVALDEYGGATGRRGICKREWLYTAISRAKRLCILVGKLSTAHKMMSYQALPTRKTFLVERIREIGLDLLWGDTCSTQSSSLDSGDTFGSQMAAGNGQEELTAAATAL